MSRGKTVNVKKHRRKLTVHRGKYTRKRHYREGYTKKDGTRVLGRWVKRTTVLATIYEIRDVGTPGRGRKVIKVRGGRMTAWAIKLGYIKRGQRISDIPKSRMDNFALALARKVGPATAQKMFRAQMIYRKRMPNGFKGKMKIAHDAITRG